MSAPAVDETAQRTADRLVLSDAGMEERLAFLTTLPSASSARLYAAVLCEDVDRSRPPAIALLHAPLAPLAPHAYMAARLTARGWVLAHPVHECMYALARAVAAASALDVMRWRIVLGAMSAERDWTSASARLLQQSRRAWLMLMRLSDDERLLHERHVLSALRAGA
ncbi:hypothetical protein QCE63_23780 [Caballeronia sp. LZ065]|uniref:hypothetical protein n=1 Tax=Caballeronia sp. LZ065 TaxID=3038571 RepID=UPI00285ABF5A|nr:hypothetical protein [Caballeronia sp. LZ065]MDR5782425.1 hypothetical protein [Caballeronia sp. LZ065]